MISLYKIALFTHVIGAIGMFMAVGILAAGMLLIQRAQTVEELRERSRLASSVDKLFPIAVLIILVPAIYMVFAAWGWTTPWVDTALVALLLMLPLGPAINGRRLERLARAAQEAASGPISQALHDYRRDPVLLTSISCFAAVSFGIVFLMTVKPDLFGSLETMVGALVILTPLFRWLINPKALTLATSPTKVLVK